MPHNNLYVNRRRRKRKKGRKKKEKLEFMDIKANSVIRLSFSLGWLGLRLAKCLNKRDEVN